MGLRHGCEMLPTVARLHLRRGSGSVPDSLHVAVGWRCYFCSEGTRGFQKVLLCMSGLGGDKFLGWNA